MKLLPKAHWRFIGFAATSLILVFTLACIDRPMNNAPPVPEIVSIISVPQSAERDVDMLFVIDNSGSMSDEQEMLRDQFSALMTQLRQLTGGLPNVHLGVTSTDLGTGLFQITYCEEVGGDAGRLLKGSCANPSGVNYIIDVEPRDCDITKDASGTCSYDDCAAVNCTGSTADPYEPNSTLVVDAAGCPRCRNYTNESLEDVFSCVAGMGTLGCGFEQPLESMYKALEASNSANNGFIRDNAFLAVILITDEDDCSAANPQLFDNTQTSLDSTLGPLTSFRCFEFGISCDINSRTHQGMRQNCVPREDPGALVHPVSRYTQALSALKDPQMLVVAAIGGPVTPSSGGIGGNVTVGLDEYSQPEIQFSCSTARGGAVPGIRLQTFIEEFNEVEDMSWAYTSICSPTFTDALEGIGQKIKDILEFQCVPSPLKGCADVGAEFGSPKDAQTCNDNCLANCSVTDIFERGTPEEVKNKVPACLEICNDGPCVGNTDRSLAYNGGHPAERDSLLPVSACWHINYQPMCPDSNFAEILISRQTDPPPRSFSEVGCVQIEKTEKLCNDLADNDEDCLVDMDDPDCYNG